MQMNQQARPPGDDLTRVWPKVPILAARWRIATLSFPPTATLSTPAIPFCPLLPPSVPFCPPPPPPPPPLNPCYIQFNEDCGGLRLSSGAVDAVSLDNKMASESPLSRAPSAKININKFNSITIRKEWINVNSLAGKSADPEFGRLTCNSWKNSSDGVADGSIGRTSMGILGGFSGDSQA